MHLVLKVALFAFEIFPRVALESVGNLSAGSLVMKRSDLHYTREGSRLLTEAFVMVLTFDLQKFHRVCQAWHFSLSPLAKHSKVIISLTLPGSSSRC